MTSLVMPDWLKPRVAVDPATGCWLYMGQLNTGRYGYYSTLRGWGHSPLVHRAVYQVLVGDIPAGLDLDHLCRVRHCCNPEHLEPVTRSENLRRSPLVNKWRTHITECPQGHEYTPENTYVDRDGRRSCVICRGEASRRYKQRKRSAA